MQKNYNTTAYWGKVWSTIRGKDNLETLKKMAKRSIDYDIDGKDDMSSMYRIWYYAHKLKPTSILDMGSGNGRTLYGIKQILPHCRLFGYDISKEGVRQAREHFGVETTTNIAKLEGKFDMVIVNDVLEHIPNDDLFIQKCKGLLSREGWLCLGVPNNIMGHEEEKTHFRKYTPESIERLFKKYFNNYMGEVIGIHIIALSQNV